MDSIKKPIPYLHTSLLSMYLESSSTEDEKTQKKQTNILHSLQCMLIPIYLHLQALKVCVVEQLTLKHQVQSLKRLNNPLLSPAQGILPNH